MLDEFLTGIRPTSNLTCTTFADGVNICLPPLKIPFYFTMRQNLFDSVPDNILTLAAPVIAYWVTSIFFHCLDISGWSWLDKYRIHEPEELKSRNHVSRSHVFWTVILQHAMQTAVGYCLLPNPPVISPSMCTEEMEAVGRILVRLVTWTVGPGIADPLLDHRGADLVSWLYWWGIPATKLLLSLFIFNTWEYFLHRWMHSNRFLYKHIHSLHHKLYVPYAFGAQYNHPLEGLLFEAIGACVAETIANLSVRQIILFRTFGTMKGVDDHCGYSFPFDPLQIFSGNNCDYHDIHHQAIGIKSNFSQPFFVHWDVILGTRMTRKDIEERRRKRQAP